MSMKDIAEFVRTDPDVRTYGETQICHSVVMEVFKALGWSSLGRQDIYSQYPIQNGFLDYCLAPDKNKVFVEVKKPIENLSGHEEQLLNYAFGGGAKLGVLTNGIEWRFYLPLTDSAWSDRQFFKADLAKDDPIALDGWFHRLLSKECVLSGESHRDATSLLEKKRATLATELALPKAWAMIHSGPDSALLSLMSETVEELCGAAPSEEQVAQFLKGASLRATPNEPKRISTGNTRQP